MLQKFSVQFFMTNCDELCNLILCNSTMWTIASGRLSSALQCIVAMVLLYIPFCRVSAIQYGKCGKCGQCDELCKSAAHFDLVQHNLILCICTIWTIASGRLSSALLVSASETTNPSSDYIHSEGRITDGNKDEENKTSRIFLSE